MRWKKMQVFFARLPSFSMHAFHPDFSRWFSKMEAVWFTPWRFLWMTSLASEARHVKYILMKLQVYAMVGTEQYFNE